MPRETLSFESRADVIDFLNARVGAEVVRDENGRAVGARGSYVMHGRSYFTDSETHVRYRVTDPIRALVGGVDGRVRIGGEVHCLDPETACRTPRASYLVPEGELTRPTHIQENGRNGVSAVFHSFFNKTPFPFPWARHGTNINMNVQALPSTRMEVWGSIHTPPNPPWEPWGRGWGLPNERNQGQHSIESAVWSAFDAGTPEWRADAVCGFGTLNDPDLNAYGISTGNGPMNTPVCGS